MKTCVALLAVILLVAGVKTEQEDESQEAVVIANNAFSIDLHKALSRSHDNLVVSPLSLGTLLSMSCLGAGGVTAQQLSASLYLPENRFQVETGYRELLSSLKGSDAITLDIANSMYVQKGFRLKDSFRKTAVENFRSEAQELDFSGANEDARTSVNRWVQEKTRGKIIEMLASGSLDKNTNLLLVNAIYFKGGWLTPFDEKYTATLPFYTSANTSVDVTMMRQISTFDFANVRDLNLKALRLHYIGRTYSMLLLLPYDIYDLENIEANITPYTLSKILDSLSEDSVEVHLPRFKIENTLDLISPLEKMGIKDVFQDTANFSGIAEENVHISKVLQKALVEVTERGTEATAATEIHFTPLITPPSFKANRPFLFMILDNVSGIILFMGRVVQPLDEGAL